MIYFVYAPPGTGKTTLQSVLRNKGLTVLDTDCILETCEPNFSWDRYSADSTYYNRCVTALKRFVAKAAETKEWVVILSNFKPDTLGVDPDKRINIICSSVEDYRARYRLKGRSDVPKWIEELDTESSELEGAVFILSAGQFAASVSNTVAEAFDWKASGFYKSDDAKRVVFDIGKGYFFVVKFFEKHDTRSVKVWKGDLDKTASFWSTKAFEPTDSERAEMEAEAIKTLQDFSDSFSLLSEAKQLA